MPFKSQSQRRFFYAAARRGEIPDETVKRWEKETPKGKKLPERVMRKEADTPLEDAIESRENSSIRLLRELAAIRDPRERARYVADMAARNHRLAMKSPRMKTAAFEVGVKEALAARKRSDEQRAEDAAVGTLKGFGLGTAGGIGGQVLISTPLGLSIDPSDIELSDAQIKQLKRELKVPTVGHEHITDWSRSHYNPMQRVARAPKKGAEMMAHELGHANIHRRKGLSRALLAGRVGGPLAGMLAGGAMLYGGDEGSTMTRAAPLAPVVGWAPTLADEGLSSIRGYKALKRVSGASPEALKRARRNLMKAFGTYGGAALGTTLPFAYLAAKKWKKKDQRSQRARKRS